MQANTQREPKMIKKTDFILHFYVGPDHGPMNERMATHLVLKAANSIIIDISGDVPTVAIFDLSCQKIEGKDSMPVPIEVRPNVPENLQPSSQKPMLLDIKNFTLGSRPSDRAVALVGLFNGKPSEENPKGRKTFGIFSAGKKIAEIKTRLVPEYGSKFVDKTGKLEAKHRLSIILNRFGSVKNKRGEAEGAEGVTEKRSRRPQNKPTKTREPETSKEREEGKKKKRRNRKKNNNKKPAEMTKTTRSSAKNEMSKEEMREDTKRTPQKRSNKNDTDIGFY